MSKQDDPKTTTDGSAPAAAGHLSREELDAVRGTPRFFEYWNRMEAVSWMGVHIVESADGYARAIFEPEPHHRGAGVGGRAVTGATQAYIFDFVTGAAASSLTHGAQPQVTVKLDCTYHHPAYDAPLTFEARVLTAGRQVVFVDATCTDTKGTICSRCSAVYYRFEKRPRPEPRPE